MKQYGLIETTLFHFHGVFNKNEIKSAKRIPHLYTYSILLDFSLTVKAATLKFISGCGSAISSSKEGKSGFIYNLVKKLFEPRKRACISGKILTVYTLNSHLSTLIALGYA